MLSQDAAAMARAASRLTNKPVTAASLRALNARLGIVTDEETVRAVARAAR